MPQQPDVELPQKIVRRIRQLRREVRLPFEELEGVVAYDWDGVAHSMTAAIVFFGEQCNELDKEKNSWDAKRGDKHYFARKDPPQASLKYDAVVDVPLQRILFEILASNNILVVSGSQRLLMADDYVNYYLLMCYGFSAFGEKRKYLLQEHAERIREIAMHLEKYENEQRARLHPNSKTASDETKNHILDAIAYLFNIKKKKDLSLVDDNIEQYRDKAVKAGYGFVPVQTRDAKGQDEEPLNYTKNQYLYSVLINEVLREHISIAKIKRSFKELRRHNALKAYVGIFEKGFNRHMQEQFELMRQIIMAQPSTFQDALKPYFHMVSIDPDFKYHFQQYLKKVVTVNDFRIIANALAESPHPLSVKAAGLLALIKQDSCLFSDLQTHVFAKSSALFKHLELEALSVTPSAPIPKELKERKSLWAKAGDAAKTAGQGIVDTSVFFAGGVARGATDVASSTASAIRSRISVRRTVEDKQSEVKSNLTEPMQADIKRKSEIACQKRTVQIKKIKALLPSVAYFTAGSMPFIWGVALTFLREKIIVAFSKAAVIALYTNPMVCALTFLTSFSMMAMMLLWTNDSKKSAGFIGLLNVVGCITTMAAMTSPVGWVCLFASLAISFSYTAYFTTCYGIIPYVQGVAVPSIRQGAHHMISLFERPPQNYGDALERRAQARDGHSAEREGLAQPVRLNV